MEIFKDKDCCVEPVLSFAEACASEHIKARELIVDLKTPDNGVQRQIGSPIKLSKSAPKYDAIGAQLGQHNQQVLKDLGFDDEAIKAAKMAGAFG
jgi:crotonobetainyl-CoA:carnitine CoA-transferase CaiB-like acyl-CoA transferase